jgi:1-acyl-sn-glycerol-3-phosphate acyltransferase
MNIPLVVLRKLWTGLFYTNSALTFLSLFPLFYVYLFNEKWYPKAFKLKRLWARLTLRNVGVRYEIISECDLDCSQPYIFCPNHTSYLDIMMMYLAIPNYFHTIGKIELNRIPLFKSFYGKLNIPVDRKSLRNRHSAYQKAAKVIDKKISMIFFPEGTIPDHTPKLGRFKNGPFKLAIEKQVPVVPVTFINNWRILPSGRRRKRGGQPGKVMAFLHRPIVTKGLTLDQLEELKKKTHRVIDAKLTEYAGK